MWSIYKVSKMVDSSKLQCVKLKTVNSGEVRDRSNPDYGLALRGEVTQEKEKERHEYFFSTGLDKWYSSLECKTFKSEFLDITVDEAMAIVDHWTRHFKDRNISDGDPPTDITKGPPELSDLIGRIDTVISTLAPTNKGVFVKLSTRSPKDSHIAFAKAKSIYQTRLPSVSTPSPNNKLILLQETLIESLCVKTGLEAVQLLVSSNRVGEDLEYALSGCDDNTTLAERCRLVVRQWVPLPLWAEFRGFVWNHELTALGQYNHPVVFEELKEKVPTILEDLKQFFASIRSMIPLDRYIIDFGWTSDQVYLVEVNPFDGEIVFPASTGLWNWEKDRHQMMNGPLELRIREDELDEQRLKQTTDPAWRSLLF